MEHIVQLLDQIEELDRDATEGPWRYEHTESPVFVSGPDLQEITSAVWSDTDAIYIEIARTALPQLAKALRAVLNECDKASETAGFIFGGERLSGMVNTDRLHQAITEAVGGHDG